MRPALVALDLDGTLLDGELRVSARAQAAVRALHAADSEVILLTGRPPRLTDEYLDTLGLEHAIVYNGASRYDRVRDECEHHHQLDREAALEIMRRLRARLDGVGLGMETHYGWYLDAELDARRRANPRPISTIPPDDVGRIEDFVRDGVIKVFARHPELGAAGMARALDGVEAYVTWSTKGLLEVMHPAVNKREALARFAEMRGIARERVAAFGDQQNDVEVLAWAGHGVAMGNAIRPVKAAADEVTATNLDDGVARVLERWIP